MIYLDSSALIKLVLLEKDSDLAWNLLDAQSAATSRISWAESRAGLARRERAEPGHVQLWQQSLQHLSDQWRRLRLIEVTQPVVTLAGDYAVAFALRGFDAVQLASAHALQAAMPGPWTFLSFDRRLNRGAKLLGLQVPEWVPQ